MRNMFLIPLFGAALVALGMRAGGAHPMAPYVMTGLLGSAWAAWLLRGEEL